MTTLITATGREIPCESVVRSRLYGYLFIHTAALSRIEADTLFSDPRETETLTAVETILCPTDEGPVQTTTTHVFRGWTVLDTVQRSPLFDNPGELMIWLAKPEAEEEE